MKSLLEWKNEFQSVETPLCPVFGECGGCLQDKSYANELAIKESWIRDLFHETIVLDDQIFQPIISSPQIYHYRHRLDLKMTRFRNGAIELGFSPQNKNKIIPIDACFIAKKEVSDYIPQLKKEASLKLPPEDRNANVVVRCGDEGKLYWGGIGKRSLRQAEQDYMWTEMNGRRIYFSLETFFQANLSILPKLIDVIRGLPMWSKERIFFDLYGGVGLFGLNVCDLVKGVYLIEENKVSVQLAQYNIHQHELKNIRLIDGRVEDKLAEVMDLITGDDHIMMVDPPRAGLSETVLETITSIKNIKHFIYLSCNPETLIRDLVFCLKEDWQIKQITPFDFFPRTKHVEVLVVMEK